MLWVGGEAGEVEEGGVEVEKLDRFVADSPLGNSGAGNDHGDTGAVLPEGALGPVLLLTKMKAVVREEDDDGVVFVGAGVESIQQAPHLMISKADTGEVGLHQGLPLIVCHDPFLGGCDVLEAGEINGVGREVVEIVLSGFGNLQGVEGVEIDPLLRGKLRDVRGHKARHEKEGLIAFRLDLLTGPAGHFVIGHQFIAFRVGAPVPERVSFEGADLFLWDGSEATEVAGVVGNVGFVFPAVKNFAGPRDVESFALEALGENFVVLACLCLREGWVEEINAGGFGRDSAEEAGPRGVAHRGLAMGIGEENAAGREAINVGCLDLGMASHAADPVVEIIDCDEEDIGPFDGLGQECEGQEDGRSIKEVHDVEGALGLRFSGSPVS